MKTAGFLKKTVCPFVALLLCFCFLTSGVNAVTIPESIPSVYAESASYGEDSYTDQMKAFNTDLIKTIEEKIVSGGDLKGKVYEQNGVAVTGDEGLFQVEGLEFSISDYGITYDEMVAVYTNMRFCHPEYYFLASTFLRSTSSTKIYPLVIETYSKKSARDSMDAAITAEYKEYESAVSSCKSVFDKVLTVHDMMVERMAYAYDSQGSPQEAYWAHSIVGAAVYGGGTCETYAKWLAYVLDNFDIDNYLVKGMSRGQAHAWNLVKMDDGNWYNIDVTWDDSSSYDENPEFGKCYGYFATPSSKFNQTHSAYDQSGSGFYYQYNLPKAADTYDYCPYYINGMIPDYSSKDALWDDYIEMWERALSEGRRIVLIYMPDEDDLDMVKDVTSDVNKTAKTLREIGFSDILSGKITVSRSWMDGLFKVKMDIEYPEDDDNGDNEEEPEDKLAAYDTDKSGATDENDVICIMQYVLGNTKAPAGNSDINGDGKTDLRDAVLLLQLIRLPDTAEINE